MALDTRLIGQALGEGRPLRLSQAVGQAVAKGEQAILRSRAQEQRRKELQAQAISQLPQLDESKVPMQMREWAIGQALEARNVALNAIRNKDMDPVERQMAISDAQQSISKIAAKTNDFKQWIAQFADTQPDDLSKLNSPELMERVNDIYSGKFKVSGDQFVFEDGATKDFNSLINTRHISRRSDAYASQLKALDEKYRTKALQGYDENAFETEITAELANVKYTDADLASIAVDELGLPASEIKIIQDDFEDNGVLDSIDKEALIEKVKNKYKVATKTIYDNARRLYKEKTKPKPTKPNKIDPAKITGGQLAFDLILDPVSRLKEVTTADSRFDKETGIFSFDITEGTEAEPVTVTKEYNMATEADIIRLARDILNNEGETSANKTKIIGALKEFLTANQKVLNERKEFYEENTRVKKVKSVLDQLEGLQEDKYSQYRKE